MLVSKESSLRYSRGSHRKQLSEEIMAKDDQEAPKNEERVSASDHTQKIKAQILEKTGQPPRLHHVEVCQHHNGNYRVNVWEKLVPSGNTSFSTEIHIGSSYYLKVSDSGEIVHSNPPLTLRCFSA
ncbi:hypothetical protein [Rubripirellula reticaptiva]|uniref:Uncharacterized protein n=1 Tax=Rubripirellula reticaptiva TaxID=2528013 RepID=A0A5C6EWB2_9BACT|nr:hypothetical protein [Rubripirellula reticaptiva]TWU51976.1 hypothetical protein Poly59_35730 [Rubripirellula reticaptiva]